jgi:hypothetical protein
LLNLFDDCCFASIRPGKRCDGNDIAHGPPPFVRKIGGSV